MTDPERRSRLQAQRLRLQRELAQQERRKLIQHETELLDQYGIVYTVLLNTEDHYRWIEQRFPANGDVGQIDWARVPGHDRLPSTSDSAASQWLGAIAGRLPDGGGDVVALWSNALRPAVKLHLRDLAKCPALLSSSLEAWAFSASDNWLVEYTSDDGWHWGRAAATAADNETTET